MLPKLTAFDAVAKLRREVDPWRECLDRIASRHGLLGAPHAARSGTMPVFVYPTAVVKLYAPASLMPIAGDAADDLVERSTLTRLAQPGVPAQRRMGCGERGG